MQPAWTYSRLEQFESCPKKYYHLKVVKDVVEPPSEHADWGKTVHTAFENLVRHAEPLPEGMTQWQPIANKVLSLPGDKLPEVQLSLDSCLAPCSWDSAWTRGIADLLVLGARSAAIIDYKTGKKKPSEQLMLYAAYVFACYPQVESVDTAFVWLKSKEVTKETFTREQVAEIWQGFMPRVQKLESAMRRESWPARPSGLCNGWCPVYSCEHNKRGKR